MTIGLLRIAQVCGSLDPLSFSGANGFCGHNLKPPICRFKERPQNPLAPGDVVSLSRVSIRPRGRDRVPASVTGLFIIPREFVPVRPCNSIQVVDHFSFSKRQLASELLRSPQPSSMHVYEAESALLESQYGDVGHGARRQMPQFLALDLSGGVPRGA